MKKIILHSVILVSLLYSCKKNEDPQPAAPIIQTISPAGGVPKMSITITGDNFSTNLSENTVSFNGAKATITKASTTELVVDVPANGTTGSIQVTTKGGVATGPSFRYYDIYVVGAERNSQNKNVIKIWRSGVVNVLTDGTVESTPYAIAVSGDDVYVAGFIFDGLHTIPTYWKNKVAYSFTGAINGQLIDIAVDGSDVYACGLEYDGATWVAKYWKNGVGTNLTNGTSGNGDAESIQIVNGDVYVAGTEINSAGVAVATYWKNGVPTAVGDGVQNTVLYDMHIIGSDVHLLGQSTAVTGNGIISYWKNNNETRITDGTHNAFARAMAIAGSDVLITGTENNDNGVAIPKLWINGKASILSDGSTPVQPNGIAVLDNDVIIAGQVGLGQNSLGQHRNGAFYAINNLLFQLTDGTTDAGVTGIFAR